MQICSSAPCRRQVITPGDCCNVVLIFHTTVLLLFWNTSGTTRVSRYQKGKTRNVKINLDLLEQEIVSGSSICWAICKSAPHPRQPRQYPTTQFFTGQMPFLPPNQQCQSTEGNQASKRKTNSGRQPKMWIDNVKEGMNFNIKVAIEMSRDGAAKKNFKNTYYQHI